MKTLFAIVIISSSILLFAGFSHGRNGPSEYWESKMSEPMPEAIQKLFGQGGASITPDASAKKKVRHVRDFDTDHVSIIYLKDDKNVVAKKSSVEKKDQAGIKTA